MFHHDMIHAEVPSKATLLHSIEIPSTGGNTLFASGYAAYETLDPVLRKRSRKKALNHYNYGSVQKATIKVRRPSASAFIPSSERMKIPTGKRSTSIV